MDVLQINRLAEVANNQNIFFCKTDYLSQAFDFLRKLDRSVILISGNSDYHVDESVFNRCQPNVVKWFCVNCHVEYERIVPVPLGIENHIDCVIEGYGMGHKHAIEKFDILSDPPSQKPISLMYGNFSLYTNPDLRNIVRSIAIESPHINWKEPNLPYVEFVADILNHQSVLCPIGNGYGDNHRIYEALYLGRIPFVFYEPMYRFLHNKMPVVLVDEVDKIRDESWVSDKINEAKSKTWDTEIITTKYWQDLILKEASKI